MLLTDLVKAWVAGLLGFLVGEYGAGAVLNAVHKSSGQEAAVGLVWLPWVLAPVLGALAAGLALRRRTTTQWWHWLVAVLVVPVGAGVVTTVVVLLVGADPAPLPLSVLVQLAIAAAVGLAVGALRSLRPVRVPTPEPVGYLPQER